ADLDAQYGAVFVGVGLGRIQPLGIPGEELEGVVDSLQFIATLKTDRPRATVGRRVIVIGGGNTAIDAVTQAKRLGAEEVTLAYRRGEKEMSAYRHEVDLAVKAGCRFLFNVAPTLILGSDRVEAVELVRTRSGGGRQGSLETVAGSEFTVGCDMVLKANGQTAQRELLE